MNSLRVPQSLQSYCSSSSSNQNQRVSLRRPSSQNYTREFCFVAGRPEKKNLTQWRQSTRASRKPPYDSLGSSGGAYYRRKARAASSPCSPKHLPPIEICELLPATKCGSSFLYFLCPLPIKLTNLHFRFMDSCARSTCAT